MDRHTIVLTTDKRQEALGNLLPGQRIRCRWEEYRRQEICEKLYVLPTPVSKLNKIPDMKEKLKQELTNCKGPTMVFAGALDAEWREFLEENGIVYWDFMKLPEVVEGNAVITAEATVAEILRHGQYSIKGQKVLVTGYGCCGEKIANTLHALGAEVIVAARRETVRIQAEEAGCKAVGFAKLPEVVKEVKTVVNTVPAGVVTEEVIRNMPQDALIVDIASAPGGTDFEAAKRLGVEARLSLGLPGIYTTTSSALLLKEAISNYAPLQEDARKDRQWIFQIII